MVFSTQPIDNAESVLKYFARYSHRVAIGNYRIHKIENDFVHFSYKDYSDNNKIKILELHAFEFIRRFLLHVLPKGLMKIRYYGLLANRYKKHNIQLCKLFLKVAVISKLIIDKLELKEKVQLLFSVDITKCPVCGNNDFKNFSLDYLFQNIKNNSP